MLAFGFISFIQMNKRYSFRFLNHEWMQQAMRYITPVLFLLICYFSFRLEISNYWNNLFSRSVIKLPPGGNSLNLYQHNGDLLNFKSIWIINYSLFFFSLLSFLNLKRFKSNLLGWVSFVLLMLCVFSFITKGLMEVSFLRERFLTKDASSFYETNWFYVGVRYVSYFFLALALWIGYRTVRKDFMKMNLKIMHNLFFLFVLLWVTSSELINCMSLSGSEHIHKLGLSVYWGLYSLGLIIFGIKKRVKYLRIAAIVLFGVTLLKLFFFDIIHLNGLAKTIIFVALGVLLLIISFLYNKYKHIISDEK